MARADGLYYERHGTGDPLLLITGWTISAAVFEPVLDRYSKHFECIVYDHRGSARSEGSSPATMGALADDAARLLTALRIPRALVNGLSMGGMVAQEMALRHPGRVRGLILGGSTPGGAFAPKLGPKEVFSIARGSVTERGIRAPLLFSSEFRREHPERVEELIGYFKRHRSSVRTIAAQTLASARFASTLRLDRIRAPTLVMHGERDRLVPLAASRLLAARIPDAELAVVPGTGHAFALEAPQKSLDLLLDWVERRLSRTARERKQMWRLTDEERELREQIRTVVLEQIRPRVRELDENCDYPHDVHETLAREGLMGLAFPAEYGGRDATEVSWCAYVEELAKISGTVSLMAAT